MAARRSHARLPLVGWREWLALPALGVKQIKAKVDTGARSSALHAFDVQRFTRRGCEMVRFRVHPIQRDTRQTVEAEQELVEMRRVTSSGGHQTLRPVILTEIELLGQRWTVELTLASRDTMGFRMLLGREALRNRFVVDPARSFFGGRPSHPRRRGRRAS